jgi:putative tryptophan/tyrosine transport system substrate-binding protein
MRRRQFIAGLGSAAAWPVIVRAQQGDRVRRIGLLMRPIVVPAFSQALADLGWTEGRNVRMDLRWDNDATNRTRALAQELVGLQPDIIVTVTTPATIAVQQETRTIPIVFANVGDPVASGIVARLDRPNGNITGFANFEPSLVGRLLELLTEIAPGLKRVAMMFNPEAGAYGRGIFMSSLETAARSLNLMTIIAPVHSDGEIETALNAFGREQGGGLIVLAQPFMVTHRRPIISAAARNNVPAVYGLSYFATDGGLLSYGPNPLDPVRRAATYVDRILRGAKPGDLPVQLPTKFEMVVNVKTAKALGLTVPQSILVSADEVIE